MFYNIDGAKAELPRTLIGYSEFRTDLAGGRHANVATMRAIVTRSDGTGRRVLVEELTRDPDAWSHFGGWSPDGRLAIVGRGWESPQNARWEEEHKQFRYNAAGWLYDMILVNIATNRATNVTAVDRISFHNSGMFFWPRNPKRLGFVALIDGNSHPFAMDLDGRNKRDLTEGSREFAYGFNASPDGKRIAYHKSYKVYIANANGSNAREVSTGRPFNFAPSGRPTAGTSCFWLGSTTIAIRTSYAPTAPGCASSLIGEATGVRWNSWTCPTSTMGAATSRSGRPMDRRSSIPRTSARMWSCSGPHSTAGASN